MPPTSGFDVAKLKQADGSFRSLSRPEYQALPLGERITLVLQSQVEFYRGGVKIPARNSRRFMDVRPLRVDYMPAHARPFLNGS